jgi:micrococcal nuclease
MGQCFSAAAQVLTELQQDDNKPQQQQQQPPQQPPTTDSKPTTPSYAHAAGGGSGQQQQQQQHSTAVTGVSSTLATNSSNSASGKGLSAVHSTLPSDAEQVSVRNVYDGDTLTLTDERRVRLLGIDTPEIKEQQPYAQESKAYTKHLIDSHPNDVYISFESGQEHQDHYGRLLAFVWVKQGTNQYICINEGIVLAGYASTYTPNANSKLHNWDKLVALQNDARSNKRGMWNTFTDTTVYKTANGSAYHQKNCEHLANIRNLTELKASAAAAQGLHPCRTCSAA